jgi:hypothetical protein
MWDILLQKHFCGEMASETDLRRQTVAFQRSVFALVGGSQIAPAEWMK